MRLGPLLLLALAVGIGTLVQRAEPPRAPQFVPVANGVYRYSLLFSGGGRRRLSTLRPASPSFALP